MAQDIREFGKEVALPNNIVDALVYNGIYFIDQLQGKSLDDLREGMTIRRLTESELILLHNKIPHIRKTNSNPVSESVDKEETILSDPTPSVILATTESVPCSFCPRILKNKLSLAQHMWQAHGIGHKGAKRTPKPEAYKKYTLKTKTKTKRGSVIETKDIPKKNNYYHCPECTFKHKSKFSLGTHRRTKHGVRGTAHYVPKYPRTNAQTKKRYQKKAIKEIDRMMDITKELREQPTVETGEKSRMREAAEKLTEEMVSAQENTNLLRQEYQTGLVVGEVANIVLGQIDESAKKFNFDVKELESRVIAYLYHREVKENGWN